MDSSFYKRLREMSLQAAQKVGQPVFYTRYEKELSESAAFFERNSLIARCRELLGDAKLHPAHGTGHCEKVAREAGALVRIERAKRGMPDPDEDLMLCVQIAGLFHDIKRTEEDHAVAGSREVQSLLEAFPLDDRYKRYIVAAVRNHEAFKKVLDSEDEAARLVSDALYDADKFRWGPDNFTVTLWLITEHGRISVRTLFGDFEAKMEGIAWIKETFRSSTGRQYGPEFIDKGMEIGREIYKEMLSLIGDV
ncbi:MAG: hypothetical protein EPN25_04175 [Nitrospirae bacterium]|nr:MAG: hypothetical protein EPN25_04175 [Nitrospirota bacterium]